MKIIRGQFDPLPSHFSSRLVRFVEACLQRLPQSRPAVSALAVMLPDKHPTAPPAAAAPLPTPSAPSPSPPPTPDMVPETRAVDGVPPCKIGADGGRAMEIMHERREQRIAAAGRVETGGRAALPPALPRAPSGVNAAPSGNRVRNPHARRVLDPRTGLDSRTGVSAARRGVHDARRRESETQPNPNHHRIRSDLGPSAPPLPHPYPSLPIPTHPYPSVPIRTHPYPPLPTLTYPYPSLPSPTHP